MIRISGGLLRGRRVEVPAWGVRPTQDRVRQALFSSIANMISGARVLDLFAGSGVLGLEACSRGAAFVCWVEADPRVASILRRNVAGLCAGIECGTLVVRSDVALFLARCADLAPFDIVLADPPYERAAFGLWRDRLLVALDSDVLLNRGGLFVMEYAARGSDSAAPVTPGWTEVRVKRFGRTALSIFARGQD